MPSIRRSRRTGFRTDPERALGRVIDGVLVRVIAVHSGGRGRVDRLADEVADLLVRGLLAEPARLDEIRRAADAAERRAATADIGGSDPAV